MSGRTFIFCESIWEVMDLANLGGLSTYTGGLVGQTLVSSHHMMRAADGGASHLGLPQEHPKA